MMPQTLQLLALAGVLWSATATIAGPAEAQETRMVPVTVDGEHVRLQMRIYLPASQTPAPTLVFNHGSTGTGTNPEAFRRTSPPSRRPAGGASITSCRPRPAVTISGCSPIDGHRSWRAISSGAGCRARNR